MVHGSGPGVQGLKLGLGSGVHGLKAGKFSIPISTPLYQLWLSVQGLEYRRQGLGGRIQGMVSGVKG